MLEPGTITLLNGSNGDSAALAAHLAEQGRYVLFLNLRGTPPSWGENRSRLSNLRAFHGDPLDLTHHRPACEVARVLEQVRPEVVVVDSLDEVHSFPKGEKRLRLMWEVFDSVRDIIAYASSPLAFVFTYARRIPPSWLKPYPRGWQGAPPLVDAVMDAAGVLAA
jgi:thioesterase domain-containing protein